MSLTIAPSPFGSLVVSVAETGSTLTVTTVATSPSVLSMALGVPGPAGATGAQGPAGTNGTNGVGVPVGGSAGQVLAKINSTNYNTQWITPSAGGGTWGSITGTLSNQTDLYSALNNKLSLSGGTMANSSSIIISSTPDIDNQGNKSILNNSGLTAIFYTGSENTITTNYGHSQIYHTVFDSSYNFILNKNGVSGTGDGVVNWGIGVNGVTFPDTSVQVTAFPGYTGTTSQYIRGDGSLYTFPAVGDRYLTSSTTSLTINNGNKTLTVGTGLSYSTQQDVTIAYNASNHMHATVTSYNSTTGVMIVDVFNKSGSGTYSSWTVNVGGVVGGSYLQTANNLSELTATASTARTNLGLGTMSTEPASAYLSTASAVANYQTLAGMSAYLSTSAAVSTYQTLAGMSDYLSTSAAASTYQTLAGMSAYLSTSAASATYLTQSNASSTYLTQANAATTYIGTSAYATTAQAQAGTSTTTVISPSTFFDARWFSGSKSMVQISWSTSVSGTGASAGAQNSNARLNVAPTTAIGYAIASAVIANNSRGTVFNSGFDFSKRIAIGLRVARNVASPDTASVWRFSIGKSSATDASDISARGIQVKVAGSGALQLLVHNGTTLTTTTSSFTPSNGVSYDILVTSDGAGACVLYVNGSSVATSSSGPTTAGLANANFMMFEVQNTSIITGTPQAICISDYFVQVNS